MVLELKRKYLESRTLFLAFGLGAALSLFGMWGQGILERTVYHSLESIGDTLSGIALGMYWVKKSDLLKEYY